MQRAFFTLLHRAVVSAPRRALHATPSSRGIFDTLRSATAHRVQGNQEKAKAAAFDLQRAFLLSSPTYTLADHQALLEQLADNAGVKSWRTMLMTDAQKSELAENLVDLKIVAAFPQAEAAAYRPRAAAPSIDGRAKERAAKELGTDVARVNRFLANYAQSFAVHEWLQERKAKGAAEAARRAAHGPIPTRAPRPAAHTLFPSPSLPMHHSSCTTTRAQASPSPRARRSSTCARWRTRCTCARARRAHPTRASRGRA